MPRSSTAPTASRSMVVLFFSAAAALMYEVVATAAVFFYYPQSSYTVATVLSVFLLGLGIGSLGVHIMRAHIRRIGLLLGVTQLMVGGYGFFALRSLLTLGDAWSGLTLLGLSALLLLVPAVFLGATFPLAAMMVSNRPRPPIGLIYAIDLAGAIGGSLIAGLWLIPSWGYAQTITIAALLNILASALIMKRAIRLIPISIGILIILLNFFNSDTIITAPPSILNIDTVQPSAYGEVRVHNNMLSIDSRLQCAYHQTDNTSERQIINAALVDLDREAPLSIMNIGLGCGNTATQALRWPRATLTVIEINPVIVELAETRVPQLASPQLNIVIGDGLSYARNTNASYDAIVIDIENPSVAHSSPLYTLEAFETFAKRLNETGRLAVWNYESSSAEPTRYRDIIAYTLAEVLPYVYHDDGYFVGSREPVSLDLYQPTSPYEINTVDHPNLTNAYLGL